MAACVISKLLPVVSRSMPSRLDERNTPGDRPYEVGIVRHEGRVTTGRPGRGSTCDGVDRSRCGIALEWVVGRTLRDVEGVDDAGVGDEGGDTGGVDGFEYYLECPLAGAKTAFRGVAGG